MAKLVFNTIANLGFATGRSERTIESDSHEYHLMWKRASEKTQAQMRRDYMANYMVGKDGVLHATAEEVMDNPRPRGSDEYAMYNRAQVAWHYHIVNDGVKNAPSAAQSPEFKPSRAQLAAVRSCMELKITMKDYGRIVALLTK